MDLMTTFSMSISKYFSIWDLQYNNDLQLEFLKR